MAELQSILATYHEVRAFGDVEEAFAVLKSEPAYAIVIDNKIRPTGGLASVERIRRLPKTSTTPVVLLIKDF